MGGKTWSTARTRCGYVLRVSFNRKERKLKITKKGGERNLIAVCNLLKDNPETCLRQQLACFINSSDEIDSAVAFLWECLRIVRGDAKQEEQELQEAALPIQAHAAVAV